MEGGVERVGEVGQLRGVEAGRAGCLCAWGVLCFLGCSGAGGDAGGAGQQGADVVGVVLQHLLGGLDDVVEAGFPAKHLADLVFFAADGVLAHERGGVAKHCMRFVLTLDEAAQHAQLPDARALCVEEEGGDLWRVGLPVAVDAAVALLDADERPRDVEVDEVVAQGVQVHALGGDIAGDKHAQWGVGALEGVDQVHLFLVRQAAVHHLDRALA